MRMDIIDKLVDAVGGAALFRFLFLGMQNDGKHQPPNGILYWGWNLFFGKAAVA